jgi:DNA-binding NarL/FixJ family response regulator
MWEAKVILIDNDLDFISDLRTEIQKHGFQTMVATRKLEAQRTVRKYHPDLVVLGTISPRGDAFQFHYWLKHNAVYRRIPLIVIDASHEEQLTKGWSKDEGLRLEAEGYFCKPLDPAALFPFIDKLVSRSSRRIRILVADDYPLIREGIRLLLSLQADMEVVGEAANGKDAVIKSRRLSPDVVLMDMLMPVMNGFEATKRICRKCGNTKVVMLTQYGNNGYVEEIRQVGAAGIVPKESSSKALLDCIRTVSSG